MGEKTDEQLRDFFAGQALEGLVHYASVSKAKSENSFRLFVGEDKTPWEVEAARQAYKIADAMMLVRMQPARTVHIGFKWPCTGDSPKTIADVLDDERRIETETDTTP